MFEYNSELNLDFQEHSCQARDGISISEISYASPCGERASALLIAPQHNGNYAGILFMHPSGTGRYAFLEEASVFCRGGAVALLIDAPHVRASHKPLFSFTENDRDEFVQCVIDLRRGVDLLSARPNVDPHRLGYVGFSYGATVGAMLARVEKRIRSYILWGGGARLSEFLRPRVKLASKEKIDAYVAMMTQLDSIEYVSHAAPSALFFQNGQQDKNVSERQATALHQAASEPKRIGWYAAGHALNAQACRDRFAWLREQLALEPLSPTQMQYLKQFNLKQMAKSKSTKQDLSQKTNPDIICKSMTGNKRRIAIKDGAIA